MQGFLAPKRFLHSIFGKRWQLYFKCNTLRYFWCFKDNQVVGNHKDHNYDLKYCNWDLAFSGKIYPWVWYGGFQVTLPLVWDQQCTGSSDNHDRETTGNQFWYICSVPQDDSEAKDLENKENKETDTKDSEAIPMECTPLSVIELCARRQQKLSERKIRIAELCSAIIENPEENVWLILF